MTNEPKLSQPYQTMTNEPKLFQPYQRSTLDTPFLDMVLERLVRPVLPAISRIFAAIFRARWRLATPYQVRVIPKWVPLIPGMTPVFFITFGQVLLALPLILLVLAGYQNSFVSHELDQSGQIAAYALLFAFITANKSSSVVSLLFGIPFERLIPYHNFSALVALVLSFFHGYVAYVHGKNNEGESQGVAGGRRLYQDSVYANYGPNPDFVKFCLDGGQNFSGTLTVLFLLVLYTTSFFSLLRRWFFEFWLITHVLSAVGVILFSIIHAVGTIWIVAIWWALDVAVRYLMMAQFSYPKQADLKVVLPDVVEVSFPKPDNFNYNAGQYVQISFPSISPFEFHPITLSSSPADEEVTLHIRARGNWSRQLLALADTKQNGVPIRIEGPFGSVAVDIDNDDKYQTILVVGGGIGVTPCQSLARSILKQHDEGRKLTKLHFVWVVRDIDMAFALPPPVSQTGTGKPDVLRTEVYLTKPSQYNEEDGIGSPDAPFNIIEGRPDFEKMFEQLKREAEQNKQTHVAVLACGPVAMLDHLRIACRSYSDNVLNCGGVKFDFHEELFEF